MKIIFNFVVVGLGFLNILDTEQINLPSINGGSSNESSSNKILFGMDRVFNDDESGISSFKSIFNTSVKFNKKLILMLNI